MAIEELKKDTGVYKAVRAAIRAAHQRDNMTTEQVLGETAEQRRRGRIRYLVVAEERRGSSREDEGKARAEVARPKTRGGRATGSRAATGQNAEGSGTGQERHTGGTHRRGRGRQGQGGG